MDSHFTSSRHTSPAATLPSPSESRARFVQQHLVRRRRVRRAASATGVALLALYVGQALLSVGQ